RLQPRLLLPARVPLPRRHPPGDRELGMTRPTASPSDLAARLHELADQVETVDAAEMLGALEVVRVQLWQVATLGNGIPPPAPGPSGGLDGAAVVERVGMSKDWIYRQVRKGRLPFARRLGRRVIFDEAGLARWLERRR